MLNSLRRERDHSQKEMSLIYLLFNELSTNHFAFPIKTVQIVRGNTLVIHPAMYNKTGNIVARFLSRHTVLTLNGFNSIKDLLSHFAKVSLFPQITKQFKRKADKTLKNQPFPDWVSRKIVKI